MFNEPASSALDRPVFRDEAPRAPRPAGPDYQAIVATVLDIVPGAHPVLAPPPPRDAPAADQPAPGMWPFGMARRSRAAQPLAATLGLPAEPTQVFVGTLTIGSEAAFAALDTALRPHNAFPLLRPNPAARTDASAPPHLVAVVQGRVQPARGDWRINAVLVVVTFLSVLFVGTLQALSELSVTDPPTAERIASSVGALLPELWRGLPYAISITLILGAHELGHYFAARRHGVSVSLPYFLPLPISQFGTLGAFIRLREPMRNRKVLLDIGAAGPLAGLVFTIPILLIGLATARVAPIPPDMDTTSEGNSIVYALAKRAIHGRFLPDGTEDVWVNQLTWAGWTGLLITSLNLIPVGQLDGGHILYGWLAERARRLYIPLMGALLALALVNQIWLLWVVLLLLFGRVYAPPLDTLTPLDRPRRGIAMATLIIFVLIFVPMPLTRVPASQPPPPPAPTLPPNTVQGAPADPLFFTHVNEL